MNRTMISSDGSAQNGGELGTMARGQTVSAFDAAKTNRAAEDTNLDGAVDARDIAALLSQWGPCSDPDPGTGFCISDFNADGAVDAADLARVLSAWGL